MSGEISYRHTQVNTLMFVLTVLSASTAVAGVMLRGEGDDLGGYLLIGLVAVWVLLIFGRLVIEIHDDALHWRFGFLPWPRWSLPLAEIRAMSPTQTTLAKGSGIRGGKRDRLYNVTLGGPALPGKVIGPAFAADEVPDVVEAVIGTYLRERRAGERFVHTARRLGPQPFRHAADAVRRATAAAA